MKYNNWFCEKYRNKEYSQHGEEGVIEELFKRLNLSEGQIVEVGASDGKWNSNTFKFIEQGFKELAIEKNPGSVSKLKLLAENYPITVFGEGVSLEGENTLNNILDRHNISKDFDLLNIDIDSWDYFVWKSLKDYHPKVVIIEIEPRYDLDGEYIPDLNLEYDPTRRPSNQASFKTMLELGLSKGYSLIGTLSCNMFFVRNDLVDKLNIPDILEDPFVNFDIKWTRKYKK